MKKQDNISESRSFTSCAPHHRAEDMGNHQWISAFLCGGHRFNQVASGGKYLDLPMESSSAPPFPVVAWGWSGPQGKWITQRGHMPDLVTKKERKKSFSFVIFFFFLSLFIEGRSWQLALVRGLCVGSLPLPHFVFSNGCFSVWFLFAAGV